MSPLLHLSDIRCKCFLYRRCQGKQKAGTNERTNEGVNVSCLKIFYNNLINENKIALKFLIYLFKICK